MRRISSRPSSPSDPVAAVGSDGAERPPPAQDLAFERAAGHHQSRGYRLANAISYALNPLVLPPVAFALLDAHFGATAGQIATTFGISLVFFCLIPLGYAIRMVRSGRAASLEVHEREKRLALFLVGIGAYIVGALLLWQIVDGPALPIIVTFAALYPINTAVLLAINTQWKISVHMTSLSGFVGVLLFTALTVWRDLPAEVEAALTIATVGPLLALVPLLMWARVRVGAHTAGQVWAGAAFGLIVLPAELWWVVYRWLDLVG